MRKKDNTRIFFIIISFIIMIINLSCSNSKAERTVKVIRAPFLITVHAMGELKSEKSLYIFCPSVRRIWRYTLTYLAPEGKPVKAGDIIAEFDTKEIREKLMLRESKLETEKKELEKIRILEEETLESLKLQLAEIEVRRNKAERKASQPEQFTAMNEVKKARMDLELVNLEYNLSKGRIKNQVRGMRAKSHSKEILVGKLEKEVKTLKESIIKMKVKAPKNGIVVYSTDWRGNKRSVGETIWKGETIMELPDLKHMLVAAVIPESQAGKIKKELDVEIRLDSNPDILFKGKAKSLGRIFRTKSNEKPAIVFDTIISINNPDAEIMRPGMAASVDIIISSKDNVLQIPESAIIYNDDGLYVMKRALLGKKKLVQIKIGMRSSGKVEILGGVKQNDKLIILSDNNGDSE